MQKRNDETLLAYIDGELGPVERDFVESWMEAEPAARDRLAALAASAALLRSAFNEVLNDEVPERLIAAARGGSPAAVPIPGSAAQILTFRPARRRGRPHWPIGLATAAALAGLMVGGAAGYYGGPMLGTEAADRGQAVQTASLDGWLDNAAGNYKLLISAGNNALIDVPASGDTRAALHKISQDLPQEFRLPDLKPWGLNFRGARLVVIDGRPAAQLIYTTDNKAIGPLTLIIGSSKESDLQPTYIRRQDVNMLYWRHQSHSYVLVGETDIGYLWGIANDVAWQLDAI